MRNKKGSMELSVNSIVILVIAIVMLGLILGFVRSKFGDLNKQFVQNEPEAPTATSSETVTMSRSSLIVNSGEQLGLKFNVYATRAITTTDRPYITCAGAVTNPTFAISVNPKAAAQGEVVKYEGLVKVGNAGKGKYLCALSFGSSATDAAYPPKDLIVEVQ